MAGGHVTLKIATMGFLVALFFSFPSRFNEHVYKENILKSERLLENLDVNSGNSHLAKLNVRLTVPFLIKVFQLDAVSLYVCNFIVQFGFFLGITALLRNKYRLSDTQTMLAVLGFGLIYVGKVGVLSGHGAFDTLSMAMVLWSFLLGRGAAPFLLKVLLLFMSLLNDERAAFTILGFVIMEFVGTESESEPRSRVFAAASLAGIASFVAFRLYLQSIGIVTHLGGVGIQSLINQFNNIPMGYLMFLEGFWLVVLAAFLKRANGGRQESVEKSLLAAYLCLSLVSFTVFDISRSIIYFYPSVFIALGIIGSRNRDLGMMLRYSLLASLLMPTYYIDGDHNAFWNFPFPVQLIRMAVGMY
jgi:hypothetical protein